MTSPTRDALPSRPHARCLAALACCALAAQAGAQATEPAKTTLERVEVVGSTPIPGTGLDRNQLPGNIQHFGGAKLRDAQAQNLPDLLRSQVGSVSVVETQGNPYQLEVNFRGFSASPLLGQPQGLSVFLDGVRLNEAFGDVVNWDLVPRNALASLTVMPGSNPLFGLNTLGGALALTTKRGDTHPGTEIELAGGSFGRRSLELSHGRALGEQTQLFVAGDVYREDGWRQHSPSEVRHLFARIDHRDGPVDATLSLLGADNTLVGNGPLPESMLAQERRQVYTLPDRTRNHLAGLTGRIGLDLGNGQRLDAQGHLRSLHTRTLNGDLAEDWDGVAADNAVEHHTRSRQRSQGLTLQWQRRSADALLIAGLSHDSQHSDFEQRSAPGMLDDQRAVTATGDAELDAALKGRTRTNSVYATTTLQAGAGVAVTASGRFNETRVTNVDTGRLQGLDTALDSDQRFRAFNPALGATWTLGPGLTVYGNASQGNRAPSPIELGCSDPANACVLPNALQSDPPLEQVVSRTLEVGARGKLASALNWNAALFHTVNRDDLLFISNGLAAGYFTNFGRTQRQGVELGLSQQTAGFGWSAGYSYL
ncbi:MAG TPA: TonB-dependent receptor, partial [Burkholderiaceae bacterium]|nr:TonB-dependent receptor [Burkholderiaceae bacterium]